MKVLGNIAPATDGKEPEYPYLAIKKDSQSLYLISAYSAISIAGPKHKNGDDYHFVGRGPTTDFGFQPLAIGRRVVLENVGSVNPFDALEAEPEDLDEVFDVLEDEPPDDED